MAAEALRPLILICDDELPLRELIKAALGDGYRYIEAADVPEAKAALAQEPEAIVLDVMLPGRSGIDFLNELRGESCRASIPVVVVSAWQSPEQEEAAIDAGADAFLGKPFDPEDLATVVQGLIAA
jgi:CheY-like chemotaxis protein